MNKINVPFFEYPRLRTDDKEELLSIIDKVKLDEVYLKKKSFYFDMKILFITVFKIFIKDGVRH